MKKELILLIILHLITPKILHPHRKLLLSQQSKIHFKIKTNKIHFPKKERKLLTIANPHKRSISRKNLKPFEKRVLKKVKDENGIRRFVVPKGMKPEGRNLKMVDGAGGGDKADDPTASEKKLESIPLLLFGDYEIIIEKK